jgi:hypothetical protein
MAEVPVKKLAYAIAAGSLTLSCSGAPTDFSSGEDDESVGQSQGELDVTKPQSLIRKNIPGSIELLRENETQNYYNAVGTYADGTGLSIGDLLGTLSQFKLRYGFGSTTPAPGEQVAYYYNRGDLGVGREMHCMDKLLTKGEIACYVANFAAGADNTQFIFGQSPQIAFNNMKANHSFATVAMAYREAVAANNNKIFFAAYRADGLIQPFAALDRTSAQYLFETDTRSTPGFNFNMHVPTNCLNCHGGASSYSSLKVTNALFLPFDLDQFEYQNVSGKRRNDQLTAFKHMNEMVWKIAARSGADCATPPCTSGPLVRQIDGWYGNAASHQPDTRTEVFEGNFNGAFIPSDWSGNSNAKALYTSVIRPMCRNCHAANLTHPFDTEGQFKALQGAAVADICGIAMPHALQTYRLFWQNNGSYNLQKYFKATGQSALAKQLASSTTCSPWNVVDVDSQFVTAITSVLR